MAAALCISSALPSTVSAETNVNLESPTLPGTAAEDWIDRLDLSGDAAIFKDLYNTLVEASDNDGVADYLIEDIYLATGFSIATVKGTLADDETLETVANNISTTYGNYIQAVCDAFRRDHPEVFWLDGSIETSYPASSTGSSYTVSINLKFIPATDYPNETAIKSAIETVNDNADTIVKSVSEYSTYEKLKHFNNILTETNEYHTSSDSEWCFSRRLYRKCHLSW